MSDHPLGRRLHHDPRNRDFPAYQTVPRRPDKYSLWYSNDVYDQTDSNCTTEAAIGVCRTSPVKFKFSNQVWTRFDTEPERIAFYQWCQKYDPPEWGTPHDGSASDSPYKGLRELGLISGWKWLFGIDEVKQWVMYDGPCSVGTVWLESMFDPNSYGYIPVDRLSPEAGGHEYRLVGYSPGRKAYKVVNSWGRGWGQYGRAWLREEDLHWLLEQQGDAVTVTP